VVAERGEEAVARVRDLTRGDGTHAVLECVGLRPAIETAFGVVRDGGTISRVGIPQYEDVPAGFVAFKANITLTGGMAPARAYIDRLLPDVLDGVVQPGRVFDRTVTLEEISAGYRAMAGRDALKVLVRP
jgi:threonine dehydrogenase-like Zn-dependent dehydrogenase